MKNITQTMVTLVLVVIIIKNEACFAQPALFEMAQWLKPIEVNSTLIIDPGGSCSMVCEYIQARTTAERQALTMEHFERTASGSNQLGTLAPPLPGTTNSLTDQELKDELLKELRAGNEQIRGLKTKVEVKKATVVKSFIVSWASVNEMMEQIPDFWSQSGLEVECTRFESNTNGFLRMALIMPSISNSGLDEIRSQWRSIGIKSRITLVFPGQVIYSCFSNVESNQTSFLIDGNDEKSLNALTKFYGMSNFITALPAGLKLTSPLESKGSSD